MIVIIITIIVMISKHKREGKKTTESQGMTPVHCRPSPVNPALQLQVKAPSVLEHCASL